ncbi:hypothetical protein THIOKS1700015 [Thiocapsa sp. KS1]|nr:hypothetical protein THIOKS1700015 [Thiocapsa sp. KS1]
MRCCQDTTRIRIAHRASGFWAFGALSTDQHQNLSWRQGDVETRSLGTKDLGFSVLSASQ